jgi:hypothetical protein
MKNFINMNLWEDSQKLKSRQEKKKHLFFTVLEIKRKALYMLSKHSITKLYWHPKKHYFEGMTIVFIALFQSSPNF